MTACEFIKTLKAEIHKRGLKTDEVHFQAHSDPSEILAVYLTVIKTGEEIYLEFNTKIDD